MSAAHPVPMADIKAALAAMEAAHQYVLESPAPGPVYIQFLTARANLRVAVEWAEGRGASQVAREVAA